MEIELVKRKRYYEVIYTFGGFATTGSLMNM
jgi:hypothetical protein